jgi:hypothetical protein
MQRSSIVFASTALLFTSCASTALETPTLAPVGPAPEPIVVQAPEPAPAPAPPPRTCDMFVRDGVLRRASLVRLVDAGLPRWMQGVEGDRTIAKGRFQGWLVKSLYPGDPCYKDLDLQRGDVVQKVNGKPIEKPEQAFDVVESLRTAPAIVVNFLREGKPRQFTLPIED